MKTLMAGPCISETKPIIFTCQAIVNQKENLHVIIQKMNAPNCRGSCHVEDQFADFFPNSALDNNTSISGVRGPGSRYCRHAQNMTKFVGSHVRSYS